MMILALEFSSPQRSVAVLRAQRTSADQVSEVIETGGGVTRPFEMIEKALRQAGAEREQIEVLAVGLGPGSYTGIRAALAVAQGWQLASGIRLAGASSSEAIAVEAQRSGVTGRIGVVIDAQRNEFYLEEYELQPDNRRLLGPLQIVDRNTVQTKAAAGARLLGPEVTRWFPEGQVVFPRAVMVAELAWRAGTFVPGDALEPIYLRETKFVKAPPPRIIP